MSIKIQYSKPSKIYYCGVTIVAHAKIRKASQELCDLSMRTKKITELLRCACLEPLSMGRRKESRKKKMLDSNSRPFLIPQSHYLRQENCTILYTWVFISQGGNNDFPFDMKIPKGEKIVESYKGVHLVVNYQLEVSVDGATITELFYVQCPVQSLAYKLIGNRLRQEMGSWNQVYWVHVGGGEGAEAVTFRSCRKARQRQHRSWRSSNWSHHTQSTIDGKI